MKRKFEKKCMNVCLLCFTILLIGSGLEAQTIGFYNSASSTNLNPNPIIVHSQVFLGMGNPLTLTGGYNVALGTKHPVLGTPLNSITSGQFNVAIGHAALRAITDAGNNTAVGGAALQTLAGSTSSNNCAFGFQSMSGNPSGYDNCAFGVNSLSGASASGHNNCAFGSAALAGITTGSNNVGIGSGTAVPSGTQSNQLSIQNTIYGINMGLSNASIGIGTSTPRTYSTSGSYASVDGAPANGTVAKLDVNGLTFTNSLVVSSDKRLKKNIHPFKEALNKIMQLEGVTYDWKREEFSKRNLDNMPQIGFLAQDVAKVIPEAVMIDNEGFYALNYNMITPVLAEGIKEQQSKIEKLELENENFKIQITELKNKLNQLTPGDVRLKVNSIEVVPNPIKGLSIVSYKLDNASAASILVISDLNGRLIKQISLAKNQAAGQVQVSKSDLPKGMYVFSIVSGNTEVQSKKVLVSE